MTLSVFATISNDERRNHAATRLAVFTQVWLPAAQPGIVQDPHLNPGMLAELYPHIYAYGPYGDLWMRSLTRCLELANTPEFLKDFLVTFTYLFDDANINLADGVRANRVLSLINDIKQRARKTHRHATDHLVHDLAHGEETRHPVFTLLKRMVNKTGDPEHPLYHNDHEEFREAIASYCYYYLLQDVCTSTDELTGYTARAGNFLQRWDLHT